VLERARQLLAVRDYAPYLALKRLLAEKPNGFRQEFCQLFERYYGLNAAGLTGAFKERYFELLFAFTFEPGIDPYAPLLVDLYKIPRRKGDFGLQCSFVSKLVAIHDEDYPIFDRYVSEFFGIAAPSSGDEHFRSAGFSENMMRLREIYFRWAQDVRFRRILERVKEAHPQLDTCKAPRITDFLVWIAGSKELAKSSI